MIDIENRSYEHLVYDSIVKTGSAQLQYSDDGRYVTFIGFACAYDSDEEGFSAGPLESDGTIADNCNIPEEIFKSWFPQYDKIIEWNAAECWHAIDEDHWDSIESIIKDIFEVLKSKGFKVIN